VGCGPELREPCAVAGQSLKRGIGIMLLKAEDKAKFHARIDHEGGKIWAKYTIEGQVNNQPVSQADKRMFASTQEARMWLIGEAQERGFPDCDPEDHTAAA
jgi:hypothetical protein